MAPTSNKIVYGAGGLGQADLRPQLFGDENETKLLSILKAQGVDEIDTAQLYGDSESRLGRHKALDTFIVSTKWIGGWTGKPWATYDNIMSSYKESLKKLSVGDGQKIDIFYMHCPDTQVPLEETLRGINDAYKDGKFKRFGLSNYTPGQVREVLKICGEKGWVKPSVYQGSYAAVSRKPEDELLPLLREHQIAFYAYSPIAGGFLTKNREFIEQGQGRFGDDALGGIYRKLYHKENFLSLLDDWERIAKEEGVSRAELAYRWVNYHSALKPELGDAIIFGASSFEQHESTPQLIRKGPLKAESAKKIDELWQKVKDDSIMDNFQAVFGG